MERSILRTLVPTMALVVGMLGMPACSSVGVDAHNRAVARATEIAPITNEGQNNFPCRAENEVIRSNCELVMQATVAMVMSPEKLPADQANFNCSGAFIARTNEYLYLATAKHCETQSIKIINNPFRGKDIPQWVNFQFANETKVHSARIVSNAENNNILVIAINVDPSLAKIKVLAPTSLAPGAGDRLVAVGFAGLNSGSYNIATVNTGIASGRGFTNTADDGREYEYPGTYGYSVISGVVASGMSGGPVVSHDGYIGDADATTFDKNQRVAVAQGALDVLKKCMEQLEKK